MLLFCQLYEKPTTFLFQHMFWIYYKLAFGSCGQKGSPGALILCEDIFLLWSLFVDENADICSPEWLPIPSTKSWLINPGLDFCFLVGAIGCSIECKVMFIENVTLYVICACNVFSFWTILLSFSYYCRWMAPWWWHEATRTKIIINFRQNICDCSVVLEWHGRARNPS